MKKRIIITASVFGMLAVIAGAFGAHGLQGVLTPKNLEIWHTAVEYQFYHAFALLFLSTLTRQNTKTLIHCYYLFSAGIVMFCGSLYLLACIDYVGIGWLPILGPVTPIGGLLFISGWVVLGVTALKVTDRGQSSGSSSRK